MLAGGGSGVALEFAQQLVPGREFEIPDMFINGFGGLTGIAIGILSRRTSRWSVAVDSPPRALAPSPLSSPASIPEAARNSPVRGLPT